METVVTESATQEPENNDEEVMEEGEEEEATQADDSDLTGKFVVDQDGTRRALDRIKGRNKNPTEPCFGCPSVSLYVNNRNGRSCLTKSIKTSCFECAACVAFIKTFTAEVGTPHCTCPSRSPCSRNAMPIRKDDPSTPVKHSCASASWPSASMFLSPLIDI